MANSQTVLVTGCAGFIGARTAELLLNAGCSVVGADDLNDYYDVRLKQFRLSQLRAEPRFQFVHCDIADRNAVARMFDDHPVGAVINLAARAGVRYSLINPHVYVSANVVGCINLLEAMRHHHVGKFVLASTSSLYAGQPMPFVETLPVNNPISPYAATKKAAEMLAYTYHRQFGIDATILRYFTVYGPAGRPDMSCFRFIEKIGAGQAIQVFGDGEQSRDFTFVDDIARGTIAALRPLGYEIINLGGGNQPHRLSTLIEKIAAALGRPAVIERLAAHPADLTETWADISKAKRLLDWQPTIPLDEGIARTCDWHRNNFAWLNEISMDEPVR